jgi:hypothetical protein
MPTDAPHAKIRTLSNGSLRITVGNFIGHAQPHNARPKILQLQQYWLKAQAAHGNPFRHQI